MSVLNQMLQDLDRRGVRPQHGVAQQTALPAPRARRLPTRRQVVWSAIVLALLSGVALDTWLQREVHAAAQGPRPLGLHEFGAVIEPATAAASTPAAAAQASAQGMTVAAGAAIPGPDMAPREPLAGAAMSAPVVAPRESLTGAAKPEPVVASRGPLAGAAMSTPVVAPREPLAAAARADAGSKGARPPTTPRMATVRSPSQPAVAAAPEHNTALNKPAAAPAAASSSADAPAAPAPNTAATATITPSTRPAHDAALVRIADLINRGRSYEAMLALAQFLRAQPRHAEARSTLAALQAERGQRDAALLTLLDGAALDPQRFAAAAARLQAHLGDVTGALRTLERVPESLRDGPHFALEGGLALRAHAPQHARDAYARALATANADPLWLIGLALAHEALGEDSAARRAFTRAAAAPTLPADVRAFVQQRLTALPGATPADAVAQQNP